LLKRIIKFKNGTEIIADVDEFDFGLSHEDMEIVMNTLMPKLILKEHKIIILETPSQKHGFFYDQWIKS